MIPLAVVPCMGVEMSGAHLSRDLSLSLLRLRPILSPDTQHRGGLELPGLLCLFKPEKSRLPPDAVYTDRPPDLIT